MKIYAPTYYKRFKCIADKCRHSCCIDWEIDIDQKTLEKYREIGSKIEGKIDFGEQCASMRLNEDGRCPFLCESGLCSIILEYGEAYLSDICREHPRFFNRVGNRVEVGLGLVCEEAARLILGDDEPFLLEEIGESEDDTDVDTDYEEALIIRDKIISYLDDSGVKFEEALAHISKEYDVKCDFYTFAEWCDIFLDLECLDPEWHNIIAEANISSNTPFSQDCDSFYIRLLKYLVYRHVGVSENYLNLRARLGFSLLCADFVRRIAEREPGTTFERICDISRMLSSEIEYSEDNTASLIFEFESEL